MNYNAPENVSLEEFTTVFVIMGGLVVWALITPEFGGSLDIGRTKLTIWATTFLLLPSLALWLFRSAGRRIANLAHLFWTAAWGVFVLHALWAIIVIFDGVADTFQQQGMIVAGGNFLVLIWWTIDVVALWWGPADWRALWAQLAVRVLALSIFAVTLVVLRGGSVQILGFIFIAVLLFTGILRLITQASRKRIEEPR